MSIGKIVGAVIFVGATAAIWMWPKAESPVAPEQQARPVRSYVVTGRSHLPEMRFVGKVKAGCDRKIRFKQSGRIQRIPVKKGMQVKKGEKLAWLFPEDFQDKLRNAEAVQERDRLTYERISEAAKKNAVSREELSKAEAQLRTSEANLALAKRALEETVLYAPFDGTVATLPGAELDMVSPGYLVLLLQDMAKVEIEVAVPETIVIMQKQIHYDDEGNTNHTCCVDVVFDSYPNRRFTAEFKEFVAAADAETQTYAASYVMDAVPELMLLPGMSATVVIPAGSYWFDNGSETGLVDIPESAVGVDGKGGYFAWKLVQEGDSYVAHKVELKDCRHKDKMIAVGSGVKEGDRIATAGVSVLTEGRKVTLMDK